MTTSLYRAPRFHAAIAVAVVIVTLLSLLFFRKNDISLLFLVFLTGCIGGVLNNFTRFSVQNTATYSTSQSQLQLMSILQVYISPLVGGAFGLVIYTLCLTGLIGGELFPVFAKTDEPYDGTIKLFNTVTPATQLDAAKALVWGFIAGFAERLVPNVLDRLSKEANSN